MKGVIAGFALCGILVYAWIFPFIGKEIVSANPECADWYAPWLAVLWIFAVPCYLVLYFAWKIAAEIGKDHSFSMENAGYLKHISQLAFLDSGYFFIANIVLLLCSKNHPGVLLASLLVDFIGASIGIAAAVLSHLVQKAAKLQMENDLTI